ncbi:hypothetical protein [Chromobacterium sp. Beijing]|uniref:hypothetical protein n=1 Tax=Chromobacterium sp. Beijing TaxID=2735795 RepID=UPI001F3BD7D9|nr:hypothetical protein [Chromobacterium sp. Beijing]
MTALEKQLLDALQYLYLGYVQTLEAGNDRITSLGGDCDPVDFMEERNTYLRNARSIIAATNRAFLSQHTDDLAVDKFATAMKVKLAAARDKGRSGWDDPAQCSVESLAQLLVGHLEKGNAGNFEDIANLCMMLHQRGADPAVLAAPQPAQVEQQTPATPTQEAGLAAEAKGGE